MSQGAESVESAENQQPKAPALSARETELGILAWRAIDTDGGTIKVRKNNRPDICIINYLSMGTLLFQGRGLHHVFTYVFAPSISFLSRNMYHLFHSVRCYRIGTLVYSLTTSSLLP